MVTNRSELGKHTTIQEYFCPARLEPHHKIIILSLNIAFCITAIFGNIFIFAALQKVKSLRPASKLLLGCLATTDLGVGVIAHPVLYSYLMSPEHSKLCHYSKILLQSVASVLAGVSLYTLTAISVDRLLALLLGLKYKRIVTLRRVWLFLVTFWLISTAVAILRFYNLSLAMIIGFIVRIVNIAASTFCYMKIFVTLRHHQIKVLQDNVQRGQPNGGGNSPQNITRYRKTVSTALWIFITLLACYLPLDIVTPIVVVTGLDKPALNLAWYVTFSLVLLNSSLNPFLYCWKIKEVRKALKDTVRQFCCFSN